MSISNSDSYYHYELIFKNYDYEKIVHYAKKNWDYISKGIYQKEYHGAIDKIDSNFEISYLFHLYTDTKLLELDINYE